MTVPAPESSAHGRSGPDEAMTFAVLYAGTASYMSACLDALREVADVRVWYRNRTILPDHADRPGAVAVEAADRRIIDLPGPPDVVLVSGWYSLPYLRSAWRARRNGSTVIVLFDTPSRDGLWWRGRAFVLGVVLRRLFHGAFVPGRRQVETALALGFDDDTIQTGLFAPRVVEGHWSPPTEPRFLWIGRFVPAKAVDVFLAAYRRYRSRTVDPWPVTMVGVGDQRRLVEESGIEGISLPGQVSPEQVFELMKRSSCLVSSSRAEPWGMVIAEAAAVGLPIVCTEAAGAGDHLVIDGSSGIVVPAEDAGALSSALERISETSSAELAAMGARGAAMATAYTPALWVDRLYELVGRLRE